MTTKWAIRETVPGDPTAGFWLEWNPARHAYMGTGSSRYATKFSTRDEAEAVRTSLTWDRALEIRPVQP